MPIVTVSHLTGSGGPEIGIALAERLGYRYVDREMIMEAARQYGVVEDKLMQLDETKPSLFERFDVETRQYITVLQSAILDAAEHDNAVLNSRGGQILLRGVPHALRVRVIAPFDLRVKRVMKKMTGPMAEGVAEVASVGGMVRQYQIDVDPNRLRAFRIPFSMVVDAVMRSNRNVGGNVVEANGTWTVIRGLGLIERVSDIEQIVLGAENGVPIFVRQVAEVKIGDAFRASALVKGTAEAVGGVVVARYGVSTIDVITRIKEKITAIEAGLPPGVTIVPFYDRSDLIARAVDTLKRALLEETLIVTMAHLVFLMHLRSVLIVTLPLIGHASYHAYRALVMPEGPGAS